jgi:NAD(P)-dependent dehydrogenase (short-subunit alcohol dehydrogenase family)
MKTVVVTGSSKGIGLGLANEFLKKGCNVVLSSFAKDEMMHEYEKACAIYGKKRVAAQACDVSSLDQLRQLWETAQSAFGPVDIWMNNAGIANTTRPIWELETREIPRVVSTNLTGVIYGTQVALQGMLKQGSGQIYNSEGFGSDDMVLNGLSIYGATKRAGRYFTESMAAELEGTPVQIGTISPGIVLTDFLVDDVRKMAPEQREQAKAVYNIMADSVEDVTPWLVEEVLKNTENGKRIIWLNEERTNRYMDDEARLGRDVFSQFGL